MSDENVYIVDRLRAHTGYGPRDGKDCVKCAAADYIESMGKELVRLTYLLIEQDVKIAELTASE